MTDCSLEDASVRRIVLIHCLFFVSFYIDNFFDYIVSCYAGCVMLVIYNWLVVAIVLKSSSIINRCDDRLHR
ncbi:MAG: hypothetical protein CM15mP116_08850 [Synechococcus sp.]|nr:MAG: hypothetical protein CM15mP116_08850 [Synechococcus sp.]